MKVICLISKIIQLKQEYVPGDLERALFIL
jgi:hypothetical protein